MDPPFHAQRAISADTSDQKRSGARAKFCGQANPNGCLAGIAYLSVAIFKFKPFPILKQVDHIIITASP
jgi:hypothetical protein